MQELCKLKILKSFMLFFVFFIAFSSFVSAVKETQLITGLDEGLILEFPKFEALKINQHHNLHIHVYNETDGSYMFNDTTDCALHLYNQTGDHILEEDMGFDSNGLEFKLFIGAGNFSIAGTYAYIIQCNTSTYGGATSGSFEVTESGLPSAERAENELDSRLGVTALIIFFASLLFILGLNKEDESLVALGGMLYMVSGIYIAVNGIGTFNNYWVNAFALILIGIGAYILIRAYMDGEYGSK